ncbi:unnamed protein product [Cyclocybe aegerita]|uniref:Uncharacterized protein n=1 Tax=Cyclocybe aegerita TaxID=1973307 RepID=A0A8S0WI17_CYCAE|nr:unnamed protein product [Cyclocybe aegerita]
MTTNASSIALSAMRCQPRRIPRCLCRAGYVFDVRSLNKLIMKLENRTMNHPHSSFPLQILYKHFREFENGDNIVECAHTGETGEQFVIATQGQHLPNGYLNMPEHDKPTFLEGEHEMNIRKRLERLGEY